MNTEQQELDRMVPRPHLQLSHTSTTVKVIDWFLDRLTWCLKALWFFTLGSFILVSAIKYGDFISLALGLKGVL